MAKNIEMQYYTGSAYEICYPKVLLTNVTGTLPISNGGTGATSASAARTALGCSATGHNHAGDSLNPASVELQGASSHGGYIDFHYGASTGDYTTRIIENSSGVLNITGSQLQVNGTNVSLEGHTHSGSGISGIEIINTYHSKSSTGYDKSTYTLNHVSKMVVITDMYSGLGKGGVASVYLSPSLSSDSSSNSYTRILTPGSGTQYFGIMDNVENLASIAQSWIGNMYYSDESYYGSVSLGSDGVSLSIGGKNGGNTYYIYVKGFSLY